MPQNPLVLRGSFLEAWGEEGVSRWGLVPKFNTFSCPQDFERDEERSVTGASGSDGEENMGWSTVNLDEEKQQQDVSVGAVGWE